MLLTTLELLVLPPGNVLCLFFFAFLCFFYRNKRWCYGFLITGTLLLYLLSAPFFSSRLVAMIEPAPFDPNNVSIENPVAIVVLGCGRYSHAPEFGYRDTISACGLERLRYAAILSRQIGLPVVASGGRVRGSEDLGEAEIMQEILREEYGIYKTWIENESRNTYESAAYIAKQLQE